MRDLDTRQRASVSENIVEKSLWMLGEEDLKVIPSAVERRRAGITASSKSCSLWEWEGGLDRPSVLISARKGLGW